MTIQYMLFPKLSLSGQTKINERKLYCILKIYIQNPEFYQDSNNRRLYVKILDIKQTVAPFLFMKLTRVHGLNVKDVYVTPKLLHGEGLPAS